MSTKEKPIDDLIYESGIIAQGCFDKYDVDALKKFAELIVKAVFARIEEERYDVYEPVKEAVMKHFGVKQ
jgi:hypothetical protein